MEKKKNINNRSVIAKNTPPDLVPKGKSTSLLRFDWAMKRLLRNKSDYTVLEGFLSVLLDEEIKIVTIKESESNQAYVGDKYNRVDIFVEDGKGEKMIIEVQNTFQVDYIMRMLYGVSKAVVEHISKGKRYKTIRKVYHINILYFQMGDGSDYVYRGRTEFKGIHKQNPMKLSEKERRTFLKEYPADILPEYFVICVKDFADEVRDKLDQWIYYFKNHEIPDFFDKYGLAQGLEAAKEKLLYEKLSQQEKLDYDYHIKQRLHEQSTLDDAKLEGKIEGEIEGEAKRKILEEKINLKNKEISKKNKEISKKEKEISQKEKELVQERKKNAQNTHNIVINSHKEGLPIETIATITGLTTKEVLKILNG